MSTRLSPPRHQAIADYWRSQGRPVPPDPACFACEEWCDFWGKLERCHIVARSIGGSFEVENFVLLCHACHKAAPMTNDPAILWRWIETRELFTHAWMRETRSALGLFGIDLQQLEWEQVDTERFLRFLRAKKVAIHTHSSLADRGRYLALMASEYLIMREVFSQ